MPTSSTTDQPNARKVIGRLCPGPPLLGKGAGRWTSTGRGPPALDHLAQRRKVT
jgi:hypothetical protein